MTKRNNLPAQQSNMNHWDKIVKNFPLTDNCIIMTLKGTSVGHQKNMQDIANAINRMGFKNVVVGSVESFDHIQLMNEAQMKEVGWIRHVTFRQFASGILSGMADRLRKSPNAWKKKVGPPPSLEMIEKAQKEMEQRKANGSLNSKP